MSDTKSDIQKLLTLLKGERDDILAASVPLREEYDKLSKQAQAIDAKAQDVSKKIKALEHPRLGEINEQIAGLAKALGGKSLSGG